MEDYDTIPPERLMDAVDAIFEAVRETGGRGFPCMPTDLIGTPDQPRAFCDFTAMEIVEAELFLLRCGLIRLIPRDSYDSA